MFRRTTSVAALVSLALVALVTAVLVGYGIFSYRAIRARQWEELHSEEVILADQLAVALMLPVWNFDHDQIDRVIEGAMQNNDVAAIIVRLADQKETAHARARDDRWKMQRSDDKFGSAGLLWESRKIVAGTNPLGSVEVFVTPRFIEEDLTRTRFLMIASVVILDAVLVLGLYFLLWKLVLKPLKAIDSYAGAVSAGARPTEGLEGRNFLGELERLRASLVTMIRLLDARFDELRSNEGRLRVMSESLAESADRLRLALEASRLGVWRRNLLTGAADWDDRMYEIFGLTRDTTKLTFEMFIMAVVPQDRPGVETAWQELTTLGRGTQDLQFRIRRPDGDVRHLNTQTLVHHDKDGRPLWIIGVATDLTDLVRATEESGRLREKLRQGQKMETLGTLAAGIAHDFNNLLTGINGFVELGAASLPPDHEAVALLKQARSGAMSARDLVRRILDFSRLVPQVERSVVSLATLVRDTAPLITAGLPATVSLAFDFDRHAPSVLVDAGQIQQVLMNLCVNGAHAIGGQRGFIRITLAEQAIAAGATTDLTGRAQPGRYACLAVADTGCGMTPEVCARIFEPFFTTKKSGEGTGLGLSIVQDVITDHGGFIRVHSEPGHGTTFEIFLPAADGNASPGASPATAPVRGPGERILVVDDDPAITRTAQRLLSHKGYLPEVFNSATEAWAAFVAAPGRYDLLLLDLQMPDLSGAEFAGRVRRATATLPIIIVSGNATEFTPEDLQRLGGIGVLPKPFSVEDLLERVAAALRGRPAGGDG